MTTLQQVELQCPICETRFRSQTVVSTNSFGGKRTDFHERAAGTQPLPYLIHTCNRCGYSGADRDFTEEAEVTPVLKERVWNELAPAIATGPVSGSEKYEAAAKVADWQGMEPRHVADLLLRAAWCCVDEGDIEAERYFRRKAAWKFEESLQSFDGVARDERAVGVCLLPQERGGERERDQWPWRWQQQRDRRGAIRIFIAAEPETIKLRQRGCVGYQRELRPGGIGGQRRAGLEPQPGDNGFGLDQ